LGDGWMDEEEELVDYSSDPFEASNIFASQEEIVCS